MAVVVCECCGKEFKVKPKRVRRGVRYCSMGCRRDHQFTGRFVRSDGYVAVRVGDGYCLEHRVIMESHLGRKLGPREHVHHRNGIRHDNRLANLEVLTISDHARKHCRGVQPSRWVRCKCLACGAALQRLGCIVAKHPHTFCNRSCYVAGSGKLPGRGRKPKP